jgi:transposase
MGLSEGERAELQAALQSDQCDGSISSRAQIVLWWDEGRRKTDIARALGTTRPTVDKWIARYRQYGMNGLVDRTSPGGPRQIPDEVRAKVLALTRMTPPSALGISHWTSTEMANYIKKTEGVYVSQTWVSRCLGCTNCSRGGRAPSRCRRIRSSRRRYATWSAYT